MEKLILSGITRAVLKSWINIVEHNSINLEWVQTNSISLTKSEQQQVQFIQSRLQHYHAHLLNEATIWARAIYPLLSLAEQKNIQAWAGVSLQTRYINFEIDCIADGVLGTATIDGIESPYLVVVKTKRGIENHNPLFQLYGQLLAAAHINWEANKVSPQEIFGCYTIADSWTFIRVEIDGFESDKPTLYVEASREYSETFEAMNIIKILKKIVQKYATNS